MPGLSELLFIDPGVADRGTILCNLRPSVAAIVLDSTRPAARQIAAALHGLRGLEAVHVIAHGAPGRVALAAGDWSAATVDDDAADLAAIGRALGPNGELRLWSCATAADAAGAAFVAGLAQAAGARVAAAPGLVGSAALGGSWALAAPSRPPLTEAGIAAYVGVLVAAQTEYIWTNGSSSNNNTTNPGTGTWNANGAAWNGGVVPAANGNVVFEGVSGSAAYTVTLAVNTPTLGDIIMNDAGAGATLAVGNCALSVNNAGAFDNIALTNNSAITIATFGTIIPATSYSPEVIRLCPALARSKQI